MDTRMIAIADDLVSAVQRCPQDLTWQSRYADERELLADLRDHADRLRRGDGRRLADLKMLLLPTGALNEIAISTGWNAAYTALANRFDELYAQRTSPEPSNTGAWWSNTTEVLPFPGIGQPWGVALDRTGALYVTHFEPDPGAPPGLGITLAPGISRLDRGAVESVEIPIRGLSSPRGIAVDVVGAVYVADNGFHTPIRIAPGPDGPEVLNSVGKGLLPADVAVDSDGRLSVVCTPELFSGAAGAVVTIPSRPSRGGLLGRRKPHATPFDVSHPAAVAIDRDGNTYVADGRTVWRSAPGSTMPVALPFAGLHRPMGVAVDTHGNVYVSDDRDGAGRVVMLVGGSDLQVDVPIAGLGHPRGVTVDGDGALVVADYSGRRVLRVQTAR